MGKCRPGDPESSLFLWVSWAPGISMFQRLEIIPSSMSPWAQKILNAYQKIDVLLHVWDYNKEFSLANQ